MKKALSIALTLVLTLTILIGGTAAAYAEDGGNAASDFTVKSLVLWLIPITMVTAITTTARIYLRRGPCDEDDDPFDDD